MVMLMKIIVELVIMTHLMTVLRIVLVSGVEALKMMNVVYAMVIILPV